MSRIIIMYGEMGSGKSYQGARLAAEAGMVFLEGDDYLPGLMAYRIERFKAITPDMIKSYILNHLIPAIHAHYSPKGLVVAQALYLKEHRELLVSHLKLHGYKVELVRIETPFLRHMRQLWSRPKGAFWVLYGLANKPFFQQ